MTEHTLRYTHEARCRGVPPDKKEVRRRAKVADTDTEQQPLNTEKAPTNTEEPERNSKVDTRSIRKHRMNERR
jgi:hypothetical protein